MFQILEDIPQLHLIELPRCLQIGDEDTDIRLADAHLCYGGRQESSRDVPLVGYQQLLPLKGLGVAGRVSKQSLDFYFLLFHFLDKREYFLFSDMLALPKAILKIGKEVIL